MGWSQVRNHKRPRGLVLDWVRVSGWLAPPDLGSVIHSNCALPSLSVESGCAAHLGHVPQAGPRACAVADDRLAGRDVPVPIGRISWSLNSSKRCCFSFPLRYLFAIGYQSSCLALDGHRHPYSVRKLNLAYSRARSLTPHTIRVSHLTLLARWTSACAARWCLR